MRGERLIERLSKRKGMMMTRKLRTRGTDNVLVDLGFDDAEELSVKAMLAMKLNAKVNQNSIGPASSQSPCHHHSLSLR